MASELTGYLPKLSKELAFTLVNRAWSKIRDTGIWSFQLGESGILTPNVISTGTVTATIGSPTITCDTSATAALTGLSNPLLTQRQFRVQGYSVYSIIAASGSPLVLTLDRPYSDPPAGSSLPYMVYQAYYAPPVSDFKRWLDIRDMTNGCWIGIYETRREIDIGDPQRLYFTFPRWLVPYNLDSRAGSSTLGQMLYELYPNPLSQISYMTWWLRRGADLINPNDTLPSPITDDLILPRARVLAYEWAEANRDPSIARGQAADYKMLIGMANEMYQEKLKEIRKVDRDRIDLYLARIIRFGPHRIPYYSTLANRSYYGG
jgi:hypothetical protein